MNGFVASLLAVTMLCGTVPMAFAQDVAPEAAVAADGVYEYANKHLWTDSKYFGGRMTYADLVQRNGSEGFDVNTLINSKLGERILERMKGSFLYTTMTGKPDHEATVSVWAEKGVDKKVNTIKNSAIPQGVEYSVFMPQSALAEGYNEELPVVFVWHGHNRNSFDAEFYGFTDLCVSENIIVI